MVLSKLLIFTKIFIEKIIEFIRFFKVCLRQYYIFIIREDNNKKDNSQKNIKYLRCGLLLPNLIYMKIIQRLSLCFQINFWQILSESQV